jgi:intracellular sulfur oxidation DsrE/DsrF family protein
MKLFLTLFFSITLFSAMAQQFPVVKDFGGIYNISSATRFPDSTLTYPVVIDIKGGSASPDQLNPALNNIARMMNLHGLGGVSANNLKVVGVIHSLATPTVISDADYQKKYGTDNPNTELIRALSDAGVQLFVCGQSLKARGFMESKIHEDITVSIAALTILTEYQLKGYAQLQF